MGTSPKSVGIIGCGWLGTALGHRLASRGMQVLGSKHGELDPKIVQDKDINWISLDVGRQSMSVSDDRLFKADVTCIFFPFRRHLSDPIHYQDQMHQLIRVVQSKRVIFTSSTSVYGLENRVVVESDPGPPPSRRAEILLAVENKIIKQLSATVLRLGGLVGPGRAPGTWLFKRSQTLLEGHHPVNLVYVDDVVNIIEQLIMTPKPGEIFNVVADHHPLKEAFYTYVAEQTNQPLPSFKSDLSRPYKEVSNQKLKNELGYSFQFPDPMGFI